jgi:hypothetical protein
MRATSTLVLSFLLLPVLVMAGNPHPEVASYRLEAEFMPAEARMAGTARIVFDEAEHPLGQAAFYLHGELRVKSVRAGDRDLEFSQEVVFYPYNYAGVAVEVGVDLSALSAGEVLTVVYEGYFNPSRATANSNYMRIDDTGVYLRSYGYSLWFPVFMPPGHEEYPVDFPEVTITTPAAYTAVVAGQRTGESVADGKRTSSWSAAGLSVFDIQCSARRWERLARGEVIIYHLQDEDSHAHAGPILEFAESALDFFARHYDAGADAGTTHVMQLPEFGDISSGNVSGISDESWLAFADQWWTQSLLAHEMVHPFTGRNIARSDPLWSFVIEGFPSYFHLPFLRESLGEDWYAKRMDGIERDYLRKRETGLSRRGQPLPSEKPIDRITADELPDYKDTFVLSDRVLLFFDYLWRTMGRDAFLDLCRELCGRDRLTSDVIVTTIKHRHPGDDTGIDLWLSSTEYPSWMRRASVE